MEYKEIQFNIIPEITSFTLKYAFNKPGINPNNAPARIAAIKATNEDLFKKYRQPENTIVIGSGSAVGKRAGYNEKGEFFGDNHISLINVNTFFNNLTEEQIKKGVRYEIHER